MPRSSTPNKKTKITPPPPLKVQPNNPNGFMENIKQGFAFGTGSALSRVFIDKMFGTTHGNVQSKTANINMEEIHKKYLECINYSSNPEESEKCEIYKKYLQP